MPEAQARLAGFIAGGGRRRPCASSRRGRCSGGAIQENWLVDGGDRRRGRRRWCCAPTRPRVWPSATAGPRSSRSCGPRMAPASAVPEPLWLCRDPAVLGRDFYLMRRIAGVAQGHRVVKDKSLGGDRAKLAERLGAELARIHAIRPGAAGSGIPFPAARQPRAWPRSPGLRAHLDRSERGHPVLEWGLRRLELSDAGRRRDRADPSGLPHRQLHGRCERASPGSSIGSSPPGAIP